MGVGTYLFTLSLYTAITKIRSKIQNPSLLNTSINMSYESFLQCVPVVLRSVITSILFHFFKAGNICLFHILEFYVLRPQENKDLSPAKVNRKTSTEFCEGQDFTSYQIFGVQINLQGCKPSPVS